MPGRREAASQAAQFQLALSKLSGSVESNLRLDIETRMSIPVALQISKTEGSPDSAPTVIFYDGSKATPTLSGKVKSAEKPALRPN